MKKLFLLTIFSLLSLAGFAQQNPDLQFGGVSQFMAAGRIVDGKEIFASDLPYNAEGQASGAPFSVMLVPKQSDNYTEVVIMKAKYYQSNIERSIPILINTWNTPAIKEITVDNPTIFEYYSVYVGFGQNIPNL